MLKFFKRLLKKDDVDTEWFSGMDYVLTFRTKEIFETALYYARQNRRIEYFGTQFRLAGKHFVRQNQEDGTVRLFVKDLPTDKPFSDHSLDNGFIQYADQVFDVKKQNFMKNRLENENVYQ